jgi:hypothetical protein
VSGEWQVKFLTAVMPGVYFMRLVWIWGPAGGNYDFERLWPAGNLQETSRKAGSRIPDLKTRLFPVGNFSHGRMARGGHGIPEVLPRPAMTYHSTPCRRSAAVFYPLGYPTPYAYARIWKTRLFGGTSLYRKIYFLKYKNCHDGTRTDQFFWWVQMVLNFKLAEN